MRFETIGNQVTPPVSIEDIAFASSDPNLIFISAVELLIYKNTDPGQTLTLIANLRNDVLNITL